MQFRIPRIMEDGIAGNIDPGYAGFSIFCDPNGSLFWKLAIGKSPLSDVGEARRSGNRASIRI